MRYIAHIANFIRGIIEKKDEFQEPSGGFLPYRVRKRAVSLMSGAGRLLDVGAGEGLLLRALDPQTQKLFYGIDLERMLRSKTHKPNKGRTLFIYGDGLSLPFPDGVFDDVTLLNIFLNIADEALIGALIKEAWRVCKANGRVIFDYRNKRNPLILLSYKTVALHDPELKIPLRGFIREELHRLLRSHGIRGVVSYYPIPSWWRIIPPAYLITLKKERYKE
jgi:ubiquinone/menaquinone biosynthesis C-methylase UbiE